jgi:hypothetical protein
MKTILVEEIRSVKTDVAGVKNYVLSLKRDIAEIRHNVTKVMVSLQLIKNVAMQ